MGPIHGSKLSTFYRIQPASIPVERLLDHRHWYSRTWHGASLSCPACNGRGTWRVSWSLRSFTCEVCVGLGKVEDVRFGVSACRSVRDLYAYFSGRDCNLTDCVIVEFLGKVAPSDDHDAQSPGSPVLTYPSFIVRVHRLTDMHRSNIKPYEEK